jgi:hypothetical protein
MNWLGIKTLALFGLAWDLNVARIAQPVPHEENERIVVGDEAVA